MSSTRFLNAIPTDYHFSLPNKNSSASSKYTSDLSKTRRLETERRYAHERHDKILHQVLELEDHMGIAKRWTPDTTEYAETARYISERRYHRALDNLQRLVTQRLFELHRLNLSGIGQCPPLPQPSSHANLDSGYKARTHLAKSLQTRCKAIRSATEVYNRAAQALEPPHKPLDWTQVSRYSFLKEFTLLRNTRHNINNAPWVNPVIRETIKRFFRVRRAHEEIQRCNIEIRRLFTSIHDEGQQHSNILKVLIGQNSPIFGAVNEYCLHRRRVNALLLGQIQQVFNLGGFTGDATLGHRKGSQFVQADSEVGKYDSIDGDDAEGEGEDADDVESDQINGILDFVTSL